MDYEPAEHRFRFAAWAAARAATGRRGSTGFGKNIPHDLLRNSDLFSLAEEPGLLPESSDKFDRAHICWCKSIIEKSGKYVEIQEPISYGRAAKLVNAYLKALYLSQFGASDPTRSARANAIHPPIDNVLLSSLKIHDPDETRRKAWSRFHKKRWTKFQERDYLEVIALVTELTNGKRWMAEAYWRGYQ